MGAFLGRGLFCDPHKDTALVSSLTAATLAAMPLLTPGQLAFLALCNVGGQMGMQAYVAFVAGPTMLFNLDKPTFASIQSKLFPKFGLVGCAGSVLALAAYACLHGLDGLLARLPFQLLLFIGALNFLQKLRLFPVQVRLLDAIKDEEDEEKKAAMRKKFGKAHGMSMLCVMTTIVANVCVLYGMGASMGASW